MVWLAFCSMALAQVPGAPAPETFTPARRPQIFLAGKLGEEERLTLSIASLAANDGDFLLFDSTEAAPYVKAFLQDAHAAKIRPIGGFPQGIKELAGRLGMEVETPRSWGRVDKADMWHEFFQRPGKVVLCPPTPRGQLLQAACLAGQMKAPLVVCNGTAKEAERIRQKLLDWEVKDLYVVGASGNVVKNFAGPRIHRLKDEGAVQATYLRHRLAKGKVRALVIANPADLTGQQGGMSTLAPWITVEKKGLLLLTNPKGDNVHDVVKEALKNPDVGKVEAVVLVGNREAIPMEQRDNPLEGRDTYIEMEPLTPKDKEPFSFAVGRIFHSDPAVVALMLARPALWSPNPQSSCKALVVSNPGGGLPLLENFSRNTAQELTNAGFEVAALFAKDVKRAKVKKLLPDQSYFLWEGHYSTLVRDYGVHDWPEPLKPSLVFLQSCLALNEPIALPFLQHGAVAVIGSTARTYSATGGAFSMAYFDALAYEKQSLGGALRHAKNFTLAFAMLKEKRLGDKAKLTGANLRSAWAFTLWGDPTLQPPRPALPEAAKAIVKHHLRGNVIIITLPEVANEKVITAKYQAQIAPNARLAGLLTKTDDADEHPLVPLLFREIPLPKAPSDKTPRLRSRLPEQNYVSLWDARRTTLHLLVRPRAKDQGEIRFTVEWEQ